jgi:hypothetical protein
MSEPIISLTVTVIEAAFHDRWGVWLSDTGWWWAARTHSLTSADVTAGCVPYLQAASSEELTERIRQQDQLTTSVALSPEDPT